MTDTDWHASDELIARFATDPSNIDHARAASLEAHLVDCARCRSQINEHVDSSFLDDSWARIADEIDRPHESPIERLLRTSGMPAGWARLISATPGLRGAGAISVVAILIVAVLSSLTTDTAGAFLIFAPLLPMAAVAASFHPTADPAGEAGVATPLHGWALAVRRTLVLGGGALVLIGLAELAVGAVGVPIAAWVLPSLALAAGALALGTWLRIEAAVGSLVAGWVVLVCAVRWLDGTDVSFADSTTFALGGRLCTVAALVLAVAVIVVRRDRFQTMEVFT
ncbi:MAG: hypothetical protein WD691_06995 [Acidimicrobiales bacterium]